MVLAISVALGLNQLKTRPEAGIGRQNVYVVICGICPFAGLPRRLLPNLENILLLPA